MEIWVGECGVWMGVGGKLLQFGGVKLGNLWIGEDGEMVRYGVEREVILRYRKMEGRGEGISVDGDVLSDQSWFGQMDGHARVMRFCWWMECI